MFEDFTHITRSNQAALEKPVVYVIICPDNELSLLNSVGPGVRKGLVHDDKNYTVSVYSYRMSQDGSNKMMLLDFDK